MTDAVAWIGGPAVAAGLDAGSTPLQLHRLATLMPPHPHAMPHAHRHDAYERHHHAPDDLSVVPMTGAEHEGDNTVSTVNLQVWALAHRLALPASPDAATACPAAWPLIWRSWAPHPPDKPPRM